MKRILGDLLSKGEHSLFSEWVSMPDHERIVAEKDAEIERLMASRAIVPRDAELLALNGKFRDTLAIQKKVIEALREQRDDEIVANYQNGRKEIDELKEQYEMEIKALENGEL